MNDDTFNTPTPPKKEDKDNKAAEEIVREEAAALEEKNFLADFRRRLRRTKTTRWIRFGVVSLLFCLWVVWMGNPWLGLLWLILLDIYITAYIPWTWWKKLKNPVMRTIFSWIDAIIYALVLVYFIFMFIGQQYNIPSSSLEKSLLVGDYLWVNKALYGPRVAQTPIHFPLTQHTFPWGSKSYIDAVQLEYHRLPGLRSIERGDIVVFNYPQGDTVATKIQNPDYYQIVQMLAEQGVADPRRYVAQHPEEYGEIIWRPVDRRENYVKRAIGLPGERLKIVNDEIFIEGRKIAVPENVQFNYLIPVKSPVSIDKWQDLGVRSEDYGNGLPFESNGMMFYNVPLTAKMKAEVEKWPEVSGSLIRESESQLYNLSSGIFPAEANYGWNRANMGEIWIPKRGSTIHLTLNNLPMYERAIRTYEGNDLQVRDGKIYINGKPTDYYTFKMDYYWMMGDNRDRSLDSRYWGFVPEDHVVGTPMFVAFSIDQERGGLRRDRFLHSANTDKDRMK